MVSRGLPWCPAVSRGLPWSPVVSRGLPWVVSGSSMGRLWVGYIRRGRPPDFGSAVNIVGPAPNLLEAPTQKSKGVGYSRLFLVQPQAIKPWWVDGSLPSDFRSPENPGLHIFLHFQKNSASSCVATQQRGRAMPWHVCVRHRTVQLLY